MCNGNGVAKHSLNSITAANPPFLQYLNTAIQQYYNTAIQLCREFYYGRQASFSAQQLCTTAQFPFRSVIQTLCAGRSRIRMTLFVPTFVMPPFHSQLSSMCRIAELLLSGVSVLVAELQSHRALIELYPTKMSVSYVAKYLKK